MRRRGPGDALRRRASRAGATTFLLLLASPLLLGSHPAVPGHFDRPNVLIIVADDLGWNDVGYHGSDIDTPNLDRLASEGIVLERFYASPFCSATRMGLLTGRWPIRWGMMHMGIRPYETEGLPPEEETIAEQLAWEGYSPRAFVGKWHVGHGRRELHPLNQGFTDFYGHYNGSIDYFTHVHSLGGEVDWHRDFEPVDESGYSTHLLTDEAVRIIRRAGDARRPAPPFLLVLSYNAPHLPNQAPRDCIDRTRDPSRPLRSRYSAVVSCLDEGIGRVLSALDEVGVADDTIVWFLSDNGGLEWGGGSNAPLRAGKFTIFEGGIRVPSIVRWPRGGLSGGNRIDALMGYIDVLPTLRRMVRANRPVYRPFDGIDVLDLLTDRAEEPDRDWFSYRFVFSFVPEHLAITSGDWKLVRSGSPILWDPGFETPVELYRIREDPTESTDVAESNPDVVRGLLCKLYSFASLQPSYAVPSSATVPEGWEPPDRWEIPPDPIPPPRLDRSQDEFRAPQDPIATAPGCPPPADEGRDVSPADEIPPTAAVRKPVIPSSVELAWTQEIGRC